MAVRSKLQLASAACFSSSVTHPDMLMFEWDTIAREYAGWNLKEVKGLSHRERANWLEAIRVRNGRRKDGSN